MRKRYKSTDQPELVKASKHGDPEAQMELYRRYYRAMYNIALRILNHSAEAEDVMQESFLSAFQKLDTFKGEVTFGAWLKRIVINKSLDIVKSRKALISLEDDLEMADEEQEEDMVSYRELNAGKIKEAMMDLPEGYRVVLSLYLVEGYDHEEISQILGITNSTSRTQYHRARRQLVKKLKELKAVS